MGLVITLVILTIGGFFLWVKVIQPMMAGKYGHLAVEAEKEFAEKGAEMKREAFENPDKFGAFRKIVPEDERIIAIASYLEPKSIGKNLLGEARTMITNVRRVNMCHFYFILTDKNLHGVAFNGEESISHDIFDLNEIRDVKLEKAGGNYASGLKDALSGVEGGNYEKFIFNCDDKKHEYNMECAVVGFPLFEVRKDTVEEAFYRIYKAYGENDEVNDYKSKAFYLDNSFRSDLYKDFQKAIAARYGIQIPA